MSVRDLINAISMGNAAETQEVFQAVMAEKISARLDEMRIEVAQNMFKEEAQIEEDLNLEDYSVEELEEFMQSEEYEQLDELSKKTLGNYIKKAAKHATRLEVGFERASRGLKAHYPFGDLEKAGKREAGIAKAVDKLTKEDLNLEDFTLEELEDFMMSEDFEQLDELSKKTLASYVNKAAKSVDSNSFTQGYNANNPHQNPSMRDKELKSMHKSDKRLFGIRKAVKKLAQEELEEFMQSEEYEQLDELSKKTLSSYIKKASHDATVKGIDHGIKKAERDEMNRTLNRHMSFSDKDKIHDIMKTSHKDVEAPREKAAKRLYGISRAANKLAK